MILTVTPNPCVDKTIFIDRIEPGAKIRSQKYECVPGGKGNNVSRAVKALGHQTAALNIVGGPPGQHVVDMITGQDQVRCIPIWVDGMTRTITTVLEESIHRQTAFFEPGPEVTKNDVQRVLEAFEIEIPQAKVVTFNGAVGHPLLQTLYRDCIPIAKRAGVKTILDSYGPEFRTALEAKPTMVKPNLEELEEWAGTPLPTEAAQWDALRRLHGQGIALAVLSLGKDGALVSRGEERLRLQPPEIQEINPIGSGDALLAGFAIGLQEDWPLEKMARLGIAAGTANAQSWDIGHFTPSEVENIAHKITIQPC